MATCGDSRVERLIIASMPEEDARLVLPVYSATTCSYVPATCCFAYPRPLLLHHVSWRRVMPCRLFPAERLGGLLDLLSGGTVSNQTAKSVLREMVLVRAHPDF